MISKKYNQMIAHLLASELEVVSLGRVLMVLTCPELGGCWVLARRPLLSKSGFLLLWPWSPVPAIEVSLLLHTEHTGSWGRV